MRKFTLTFCLAVLLSLVSQTILVNAKALGLPAQQAANEQYLWIPGPVFKPRSAEMIYSVLGNDSLVSGSLGSGDHYSFTVPIWLPTGSTLKTVRLYYYDKSARNAELRVSRYNGMGSEEVLLSLRTSGTPGQAYVDGHLGEDFLGHHIQNQAWAYALNWYPHEDTDNARLRAVRLTYTAPVTPPPTDYMFIPGSAYNIDSHQGGLRPGQPGCSYGTGGGANLYADINLPTGTVIEDADYFYYDINPKTHMLHFLVERNKDRIAGKLSLFFHGFNNDSSGFGTYSPANVTNPQVDQGQNTYYLTVWSSTETKQACGVRLKIRRSPSTASISAQEFARISDEFDSGREDLKFVAAEQSLDPAVQANPTLSSTGQTYLVNQTGFPTGARLKKAKLYFFKSSDDPMPFNAIRAYGQHEGGVEWIGNVQPTTNIAGYQSVEVPLSNELYITNREYTGLFYAVFDKSHVNYAFCSLQIEYELNGRLEYRFIDNKTFHPTDSSYGYGLFADLCTQQKEIIPPTDPGEPGEPWEPGEPGEPGDPGEPGEPGDPNDPGAPADPQRIFLPVIVR